MSHTKPVVKNPDKPATPGEVIAALGPVVVQKPRNGPSWKPLGNIVPVPPTKRPEWLDKLRRPIRVIAESDNQLKWFGIHWRFTQQEIRRVHDRFGLDGVTTFSPILILPLSPKMTDDWYFPREQWQARGGRFIEIPEDNLLGDPFSDGFNLVASTICELCKANR